MRVKIKTIQFLAICECNIAMDQGMNENLISRMVDRSQYRRRVLVFFVSSSVACLLGFLFYLLLSRPYGGIPDPGLSLAFFLLSPTVFLMGILVLLLAHPSVHWIAALDFAVTLFAFLSLTLLHWVWSRPPSLEVVFGLILLWHAVIVPTSARLQTALGASAIIAFLAGKLLSHDPALQHVFGAVAIPALALFAWVAISVIMSSSLFHSRASVFQAENLGNYHIVRELGAGGMGKVYEATHAYLCRPTALKVMQVPAEGDVESAIARFEKEIKFSATLTHPNSISIFDFGQADSTTFFYAMELLSGLDLQKLIDRFGPLPYSRAIYILLQTTGALAEAHDKGIIHRDIKPSNIFLAKQGGLYDFVKILDFGLAKEVKSGKQDLTRTGELLGTPRYLAPETITAAESSDRRTDIYMLGAVAYFMVTGKAPFEAKTSVAAMADSLSKKPKIPSEVSELKIPPALDEIVLKTLEKKQEDRFQTVQEFADALRKVPDEDPWSQKKAEAWWKLHFPGETSAPTKKSAEPIVLRTITHLKKS